MDIIKNYNEIKDSVYGEDNCNLQLNGDTFLVKERKEVYHSVAVKAHEILGMQDAYYMSAQLKLNEITTSVPFVATFKLTVEYLDLQYTTYDFGIAKNVSSEQWTKLENKIEIPPGAKIISLIAYFVQRGSKKILPDILVKDLFVEKAEASITVTEQNKKPRISRQKRTTIGAIRWDAYNATGTNNSFVSNQVAKALTEYPENAPFFSKIDGKGKIQFPVPTQEQFDIEAKLATDAEIDYFAYCWYDDKSQMAYARQQHLLSKYKNHIKMCAIIGVGALDDGTLKNLCLAMKEDCYLKFDSRPVVYVYDAYKIDIVILKNLENFMKDAGITAMPYYIGMVVKVSPFIINTLHHKGIDAISAYACLQRENVETFIHHAENVIEENNERYAYYKDIDVIPLISCGRDSRPRIKNPVSWAGDYGGKYIVQPTFEELRDHVTDVIRRMTDEEKNVPNTALIYAWNEHDEGAWCCPTLTENGINSTFLNALKEGIKESKK